MNTGIIEKLQWTKYSKKSGTVAICRINNTIYYVDECRGRFILKVWLPDPYCAARNACFDILAFDSVAEAREYANRHRPMPEGY
jgi:hypothetical protein